ncbi:MAG: phosphatidate cytidylyltransferase [Bacteroidota bacterium]
MKNIWTRTITGSVFIIIIIGSILLSVYTFVAVFLLVTVLGQLEFYKLYTTDTTKPQRYFGVLAGIVMFLSIALYAHHLAGFGIILINIPVLMLLFIFELYRKKEMPFTNVSITILGVLYIALSLALLNFLFSPFQLRGEFHTHFLIAFFTITWVVDTAAYLVGMAIGKHRLFERISPKKSWEGAIGGLVMGVVAAYVISLFFRDVPFYHWAVISIIISVAGGYGDLVESMFKRSLNIKDSGAILPGHGGILDRFDCVLFSAPFVFIYIYFFISNLL